MTRLRRATLHTFRSLQTRNYRLFFFGQLVSVSGSWMQWVAQGWLVLRLGGGGLELGLATGLQFFPTFLAGMWGGLVADRFDRRRILVLTQVLAAGVAFTLGALTATDAVRLWMVYLMAFLAGCVLALEVPARQAFVSELVEPEHVANAIALNSANFNAGRILGPAVAAALIAGAGIAWAFLLNGVSYLFVVGALAAMDPDALHLESRQPRARGQLREGLRYVWHTPALRDTILLVGIVATFAFNFTVVLPLLAQRTFHGGAGAYGLLTSIMATGSMLGGLFAASRSAPTRGRIVKNALGLGISMLAAAIAPNLWVEAVLLVPVGGFGIALFATANSFVQGRTPGFMRGRVMALYSLVFLGGNAIGGPVAGWVCEAFGPRAGLVMGGVAGLTCAAIARVWLARAMAAKAEAAALAPSGDLGHVRPGSAVDPMDPQRRGSAERAEDDLFPRHDERV